MLLVDRVAGHPKFRRDVLPRPTLGARTADLGRLQMFEQSPQRADGPQPDLRVTIPSRCGEIRRFRHDVNVR